MVRCVVYGARFCQCACASVRVREEARLTRHEPEPEPGERASCARRRCAGACGCWRMTTRGGCRLQRATGRENPNLGRQTPRSCLGLDNARPSALWPGKGVNLCLFAHFKKHRFYFVDCAGGQEMGKVCTKVTGTNLRSLITVPTVCTGHSTVRSNPNPSTNPNPLPDGQTPDVLYVMEC